MLYLNGAAPEMQPRLSWKRLTFNGGTFWLPKGLVVDDIVSVHFAFETDFNITFRFKGPGRVLPTIC